MRGRPALYTEETLNKIVAKAKALGRGGLVKVVHELNRKRSEKTQINLPSLRVILSNRGLHTR